MHQSAFVIAENVQGEVLAVSRGPGAWVWSVPGGGLEPGETHAAAAARELWEETGLLPTGPLEPLIASRDNRRVYFRAPGTSGRLRGSHEGDAAWVPWEFLIARGGRWSKLFAALRHK